MYRDIKYLFALTLPLFTYVSLMNTGFFAYAVLVYAFVMLPVLEFLLPKSSNNIPAEDKPSQSSKVFFDWMLYANVPIIYLFIVLFFSQLAQFQPDMFTAIGWALSLGVLMGAIGINVAHELGHKPEWYKQVMAKALLLPCMYMHFYIEHNQGHHKHVATDLDPASARKNEAVYAFWLRSLIGSFISAFRIEVKNCKKKGRNPYGFYNQVILFAILQLLFLAIIYIAMGAYATSLFLLAAFMSILLLETINYIEHYGLRRELLPNGRYERVRPCHSWNSNHELGRIVLYELTRHSDHHYLANKKYQLLDHHEEAKQLPYGYPTSMVLSLIPPLWYKIMNKRL